MALSLLLPPLLPATCSSWPPSSQEMLASSELPCTVVPHMACLCSKTYCVKGTGGRLYPVLQLVSELMYSSQPFQTVCSCGLSVALGCL